MSLFESVSKKSFLYIWLVMQMLSDLLASFYAESLLKNSFTTPLGESLSPPLDLESLFGQDQWTITDDCALLFFLSLSVFYWHYEWWSCVSLSHFSFISTKSNHLLPSCQSMTHKARFWRHDQCEWLVKLLVLAPCLSTTGWSWWWGSVYDSLATAHSLFSLWQ